MELRYEVKIANGAGQTKVIGKFGYKSDALAAAKRFVNASVIRQGRRGSKVVYTHNHSVKSHAAGMFTLAGAKKAVAPTTR
jgi:hypothetical protein